MNLCYYVLINSFVLILSVIVYCCNDLENYMNSSNETRINTRRARKYTYDKIHEDYDNNYPLKGRKLTLKEKRAQIAASDGCTIDLNADFGEPGPVCIYKDKLLEMDMTGQQIDLPFNANITVACPGPGRLLVFDTKFFSDSVAVARCVHDDKFEVGKFWIGKFKQIECSASPHLEIHKTDEKCYREKSSLRIYIVGFLINDTLYELYRACFDSTRGRTLFAYHRLSPHARRRQLGGSRPYYTYEKPVFGNFRIGSAYNIPAQRRVINKILGRDANDDTFINEIQFLARTQLAPRLDFVLRSAQRSTFTYLNTVPQWRHIKENDWARLEDGLRSRAHELNKTLRVWTGTHKIWSEGLQRRRQSMEIFLGEYPLGRKQKIVPVPLYIYKLVYLDETKQATAFISINLPANTQEKVLRESIFCEDQCLNTTTFPWLRWVHKESVSFCCTYAEFYKRVKYLPDIEVLDIFY